MARVADRKRVHLVTVAAELATGEGTGIDHCAFEKVRECARIDRFGIHSLTDNAAEADLILFAELGFSAALGHLDSRLRKHSLVRSYRPKCFVYNSADSVIPFLPGIYPSIEGRWHDRRRTRSGHYLSTHTAVPPLEVRPFPQRDLLFSFLGSATSHPVRQRIVDLRHERGWCRDTTTNAKRAWNVGGEALAAFTGLYSEVMSRSRFALCPRGLGTSSMRLFESLRFGVAPVVIADQWVAPSGPDWSTFSLRVREADVASLPRILEEQEHRSEEMGRLAREAWENWFADDVSFHRIVEWCLEIQRERGGDGDPALGRLRMATQLARPRNLRASARHLYRSARAALR